MVIRPELGDSPTQQFHSPCVWAQRGSLHLEVVESGGALQCPELQIPLLDQVLEGLDGELLAAGAQQGCEVGDVGSQQGQGEEPPDHSNDPH